MRRIPLARRLLYLLVLLLLAAALVEGALQLTGWIYLQRARTAFGQNSDAAILCLGDSFTYGIGAGPSQSYPAHLAAELGNTWQVTNGGHPYMDSTSLLAGFSQRLMDAKPQIVVLLIGYNNRFKNPNRPSPDDSLWATVLQRLRGLKIGQLLYILNVNRAVDAATGVAAEIPALSEKEVQAVLTDARFAAVQRVFTRFDDDHAKVLTATGSDADTALAKGIAYLIEGEGRLAEPLFFRVLAERPDDEVALMGAGYVTLYRREIVIGFTKALFFAEDPWLAAGMATVLYDRGRSAEAISRLTETLESHPNYAGGYELLAGFLLKEQNPGEALVLLDRLEALEPWRAELHWLRAEALLELGLWIPAKQSFERAFRTGLDHPSYYARLRRLLLSLPADPDAALNNDPTAYAIAPLTTTWRNFAAFAEEKLARQTTSRTAENLYGDLAEMHAICQNLGVTLVLMSYPDRYAYDDLRAFAAVRDVPFVDNVATFENALRDTAPTLLFQPDGHCTSRGYRLMAHTLHDVLTRAGALAEGATP
ncbi:MAG: GDSL-type esterase/lipase family protein [Candidatus Lernaella stagnicola]|nr:GDSL-type esterase/lipase family protein [Candidatus Lernaella stagnicola]